MKKTLALLLLLIGMLSFAGCKQDETTETTPATTSTTTTTETTTTGSIDSMGTALPLMSTGTAPPPPVK